MNTSLSMRKFSSRKEFKVLPKDAGLPREESESPTLGLPEELESPTQGLPEESKLPSTPGLPTPGQNNGKDRDQPDDKSWTKSEVIGEVFKYCLQIGVIITVLVFQVKGWPRDADIYDTDDPSETSRGGETYTCGCSLPASLGLGAVHEDLTSNTSLNICYEKSSLDTVTILTYSKSSAAKIESTFAEVHPDKFGKIHNLQVAGYKVTQDAYDLAGSIDIDNGDYYRIEDLALSYIGGQRQLNKHVELFNGDGELMPRSQLNPSLLIFLIQSYVRLYFEYYCDSCLDCAPDLVNNAWNEISNKNDWWVSCYFSDIKEGQGNSWEQICQPNNLTFFVKGVVYPAATLPPTDAIWQFLNEIGEMHGYLNLSISGVSGYDGLKYSMHLEPSHLYLNISQVQSSSVQLKFVEVIKNSALWVRLLTLFPTLGNECATMPRVQVCNGTSVCNIFAYTNYDLKCLDMKNKTQCKQLMTDANSSASGLPTIVNTERSNLWSRFNVTSWSELECPEFICESEVHPYFVMWEKSPKIMENDTLNRFLHRWILDDYWAQRSGVCTKTYSDVYRYPRATSGADEDGTMFLQTNCTNMSTSWKNPDGYCWLTARYHNISDSPTEDWKPLREDDPLFANFCKRFICYRVKRAGFGSWFIATMGILFGWIGTVDLISKWFAKRIQPWIRKKEN